jgi:hypothetical protein
VVSDSPSRKIFIEKKEILIAQVVDGGGILLDADLGRHLDLRQGRDRPAVPKSFSMLSIQADGRWLNRAACDGRPSIAANFARSATAGPRSRRRGGTSRAIRRMPSPGSPAANAHPRPPLDAKASGYRPASLLVTRQRPLPDFIPVRPQQPLAARVEGQDLWPRSPATKIGEIPIPPPTVANIC